MSTAALALLPGLVLSNHQNQTLYIKGTLDDDGHFTPDINDAGSSDALAALALLAPAANAVAVTPSDGDTLAATSRELYVGTGGNVAVTMAGGGDVVFKNVPNSGRLPIRVTKVLSSGTTASDIVALY